MSTDQELEPKAEMERLYHEIREKSARLKELGRQQSKGVMGDVTLAGPGAASVSLAEAFGDRSDLIVIQNMGRSCPYCTLWADGFMGLLPHLEDRAAVVLVSPDDPATQQEFAAGRGWRYRMLSSAGTSFKQDLGFADDQGSQMPGVSTFHRADDGTVTHVASDYFGPGDSYNGLWHFLDLLRDGPDGWQPKFNYEE